MEPEGSYRVYNSPKPVPIPNRINPVHATPNFLKIHFNIILLSRPGSSMLSLSFRFPQQNPVYTSLCAPDHLIFDLITRKIFVQEYRSLSSWLCSFLHSPVTSPLIGPNIRLSALFSNNPSLCSSFNMGDHVSHPYKTTAKLYFCVS